MLVADLVIRSGMCIVQNMWLSVPRTTPYLAERRQGALHCNGFRVSSPMLQRGLRKRRGVLGVVLGTSQYIVGHMLTLEAGFL